MSLRKRMYESRAISRITGKPRTEVSLDPAKKNYKFEIVRTQPNAFPDLIKITTGKRQLFYSVDADGAKFQQERGSEASLPDDKIPEIENLPEIKKVMSEKQKELDSQFGDWSRAKDMEKSKWSRKGM